MLPLAHVKSVLFGDALVSLPFAVYGGVVAGDRGDAAALLEDGRASAGATARRRPPRDAQCRGATSQWPRQDLYVTFRKEMLADARANLLAVPRKQRAMVRKGINNGLVSEIDPTTDRFFALYADNVRRHGTPALPKRYFETLRRVFDADCEVLTVVDRGGQPVSSVLSFYFRDEVLPYYAGDAVAARDLAANDFKYWELMRPLVRGAASRYSISAAASRRRGRTRSSGTGVSSRSSSITNTGSTAAMRFRRTIRRTRSTVRSSRCGADCRFRSPISSDRAWREASADAGIPMESILFLAHRLPFPPNKGDKVRSYHFLKHLAARYRVFLGTFVDDPLDWKHVEKLRGCASRRTSRRSRHGRRGLAASPGCCRVTR